MQVIRDENGKAKKVLMTQKEYDKASYTGVWTTERWDIPDWENEREKYMGKRTWMPPCDLFGGTCLLVEGMGFEIVD